eukprot:5082965-Amphidinium_carterae.1
MVIQVGMHFRCKAVALLGELDLGQKFCGKSSLLSLGDLVRDVVVLVLVGCAMAELAVALCSAWRCA